MQKWLLWTEHQYRLPPVGKAFQELGGKELCAMSEEQFRQRSPLGGEVLHAHLDIWKSGGTRCGWERPLPGPELGTPSGPVRPGCWPGGYSPLGTQPLGPSQGSLLDPSPKGNCLPVSWLNSPAPTCSQPWSSPQHLGQSTGEVTR